MTTPLSPRFSRNLSLVAFAPLALGLLLIVMGQAMATPAGVEGDQIVLRAIDRHPADVRSARRTYDRIDLASLQVCGGGDHSSPQVNYAVRRSSCWHDAMSGALAQVSTPYLAVAPGEKIPSRP